MKLQFSIEFRRFNEEDVSQEQCQFARDVRNLAELGKDTLAGADETRGRADETDERPR